MNDSAVLWVPAHPFRNHDLEPCPFPGLTRLTEGDACDVEDLAGNGEPKSCILPIASVEDLLFFIAGDPYSIVFTD